MTEVNIGLILVGYGLGSLASVGAAILIYKTHEWFQLQKYRREDAKRQERHRIAVNEAYEKHYNDAAMRLSEFNKIADDFEKFQKSLRS